MSKPTSCRWTAGLAPIDGAGNIYANVLEAFLAIMPPAAQAHLEVAREAGRLLARSIVCADRVIDGDLTYGSFGENVLAAQICQLDAVRLLQRLVPADHEFWSAFASRLRELADACLAELADTERDVAAAERIALGKNAVARLAASLACVLGGTAEPLAELDRAVVELIAAVQALDDAADWRADLARGQLSLVTARIWMQLGRDATGTAVDVFVYRVALPEVLHAGRTALENAMTMPALRGSAAWTRMTGKIAHAYDHAIAVLPFREARPDRSSGAIEEAAQ
ncbi:MAG TPA: hypothetical protein VFV99_33120 [Kofleriaceae bacterium]|nr:hypothetical protein [Kofleriaceae bacterium]